MKIYRRKVVLFIFAIVLIDIIIGYFFFTNRSFPRLALWKIIESNDRGDFYWEPEDKPPYFHFEPDGDKLSAFREEVSPLIKGESDELKIALIIAKHAGNIKAANPALGDRRLRWDSPEGILKQIRAGKTGNCFHYSILYSTYLSGIGIKSRLWTLEGDDGLDKLSHTVCEVYLPAVKKWLLIDAFWGVYFLGNDKPLSVLELRDALLAKTYSGIVVESVKGEPVNREEVLRAYAELMPDIFLRAGNDFSARYESGKRYGILSPFSAGLDRLPSEWRRGISYLAGRRDALLHYADAFSARFGFIRIAAIAAFYFFILSLPLLIIYFGALLLKRIRSMRRSKSQTPKK